MEVTRVDSKYEKEAIEASRCSGTSWVEWLYPVGAFLCLISVCIFANRVAFPDYETAAGHSRSHLSYSGLNDAGMSSLQNGSNLAWAWFKMLIFDNARATSVASDVWKPSNEALFTEAIGADVPAPYVLRLFPTIEQLTWMETTMPTSKEAMYAQVRILPPLRARDHMLLAKFPSLSSIHSNIVSHGYYSGCAHVSKPLLF